MFIWTIGDLVGGIFTLLFILWMGWICLVDWLDRRKRK